MFQIDTGNQNKPAIGSFGAPSEHYGNGVVTLTDPVRAERFMRHTITAVWAVNDAADLDLIQAEHDEMLESLYLNFPDYWEKVDEAFDECRAIFAGAAKPSAQADPCQSVTDKNQSTNKETKMFDIDTAASTSGPFINWKAQRKVFDLRKSADDITEFNGFSGNGVILDIEKIKVGWQYTSGVKGQAPDWKWWPAPNQRIEKPNDEYKWGISIPCAIGNGDVAYWEQAGAAVQNAIANLTPALKAGETGKLPLVRVVGSETMRFNVGSTEVPTLEVVSWHDRPDCLKEGASAGIDTAQAAAAAQQTAAPADSGATAGGF